MARHRYIGDVVNWCFWEIKYFDIWLSVL